ncbi:hypothetical protein QSJ19_01525 [Gordonia sp. ABSL11-1]|uniref:hypothetical protein n=1 Tax=Gordonia sp. ABSL11-1 TaxID=3053924 RepID=UPI002572FA3D|nr:hypothetical protein [Gordonia sp. ABSL11-1]MDL9944283.1 hypothetical protein [Gordonia sp. ABSL11-1]
MGEFAVGQGLEAAHGGGGHGGEAEVGEDGFAVGDVVGGFGDGVAVVVECGVSVVVEDGGGFHPFGGPVDEVAFEVVDVVHAADGELDVFRLAFAGDGEVALHFFAVGGDDDVLGHGVLCRVGLESGQRCASVSFLLLLNAGAFP